MFSGLNATLGAAPARRRRYQFRGLARADAVALAVVDVAVDARAEIDVSIEAAHLAQAHGVAVGENCVRRLEGAQHKSMQPSRLSQEVSEKTSTLSSHRDISKCSRSLRRRLHAPGPAPSSGGCCAAGPGRWRWRRPRPGKVASTAQMGSGGGRASLTAMRPRQAQQQKSQLRFPARSPASWGLVQASRRPRTRGRRHGR